MGIFGVLPEAAHATPVRSITVAATPLRLRKYAMLEPIMPAPQITTLGKCPRLSCCHNLEFTCYIFIWDTCRSQSSTFAELYDRARFHQLAQPAVNRETSLSVITVPGLIRHLCLFR